MHLLPAFLLLGALGEATPTPTATVTPAPTRVVVRATTDPSGPTAFSETYGSRRPQQTGNQPRGPAFQEPSPTPPPGSLLGLGLRNRSDLQRLLTPGGITTLVLVGGKHLEVRSLSRDGQYVYVTYKAGTGMAFPIATVDWDTTLKLNPAPAPEPAPLVAPASDLHEKSEAPPNTLVENHTPGGWHEVSGTSARDTPTVKVVGSCLWFNNIPVAVKESKDGSWEISVRIESSAYADSAAKPIVKAVLRDGSGRVLGQTTKEWPVLHPGEDAQEVLVVPIANGQPVTAVEVQVSTEGGCPASVKATSSRPQPEDVVSASNLYLAFKRNVAQANEQYGEKRITVYGYVEDIDTSLFGDLVIRLHTNYDFGWVSCYLRSDAGERLKLIQKGNLVSIIGVCDRGLPVSLRDCNFE